MDEEQRIIYLENKDEDGVVTYFQKIESDNFKLSQFILENLQKNGSIGVRKDVLAYVSENAADFGADQSHLFNIASFICNLKVTVEHLRWVNDLFNHAEGEAPLKINDFGIIFLEAVEKDIPLNEIKQLFLSETGEVAIYTKVVEYGAAPDDEGQENTTSPVAGEGAIETKKGHDELGYADMFSDIITVMSLANVDDNSVQKVSENINKIIAKHQRATSELASYASEIIRRMEDDKKENVRLTALLKLQQRLMASQQQKINEMRGETARLNSRIQNMEKSEMRQRAINQKINELQNLTFTDKEAHDMISCPDD